MTTEKKANEQVHRSKELEKAMRGSNKFLDVPNESTEEEGPDESATATKQTRTGHLFNAQTTGIIAEPNYNIWIV